MSEKGNTSIVFVNQSSGYLMIDIIHEHLDDFDEIVLFTGYLNPRNHPLNPKVKVHFLKAYSRSSIVKRLWSWSVFTLQTFWLLSTKYRNSSVYFVSNPPFVTFLGSFLNREMVFLIYDVYPDTLSQHHYLKKSSIIYRLWERMNKHAFHKAKKIFTISQGMASVLSQYVSQEKVQVVPVWTDNNFLKPIDRQQNWFLQKHHLENQFVVMYSGNIGKTHPVEIMLEVAEKLLHKNIAFVIIGEGDKKTDLQKLQEEKNLSNVLFLPFQETKDFPISLAAAQLSVVTLGEEASNLSVPSKTFNIMSVGTPILGIAERESELAQIIQNNEVGKCFTKREKKAMVRFIEELVDDPISYQKLALNSQRTSKLYSNENAANIKFSN